MLFVFFSSATYSLFTSSSGLLGNGISGVKQITKKTSRKGSQMINQQGYDSGNQKSKSGSEQGVGEMLSGITNGVSGGSGGSGGFDINAMLQAVNQVRSQAGAQPLQINDKLVQAAQTQSDYQAQTGQMSHSGAGGTKVSDRCKQAGYNYSAVAENVAEGQTSVSQVMNSWINSPGHYQNLVNSKYTDFGAAMNNNYWTQVFGSSSQ